MLESRFRKVSQTAGTQQYKEVHVILCEGIEKAGVGLTENMSCLHARIGVSCSFALLPTQLEHS